MNVTTLIHPALLGVELEQALVGAVIAGYDDAAVWPKVRRVQASDFADGRLAAFWQIITDLDGRADVLLLADHFPADREFLADLFEKSVATQADLYAGRVVEASARRALAVAQRLSGDALRAEIAAALARLTPPQAHESSSPAWFDDVVFAEEEWLIERILPTRAYVGLFGRRSCAKTFLALEMAARGALGQPFLGEQIPRPFGSLFCVGEKRTRFGKRVAAWRQEHGSAAGVQIRFAVPDLLDPGSVEAFIVEVLALKPEFERRGAPLGCIFLDTLARALRHANVSDAEAAGIAIEAIQRIVEQTGVTVVAVAHMAKAEESNSQKGAGEWEDSADALVRIDRRDQEATRVVTLTKQSDDADGLAYAFDLDVVDLGATKSGRRVTSCVVRQTDLPELDPAKPKPKPLTAPAQTVLTALGRMLDNGEGQVVTAPGAKPKTTGVAVAALRARSYALGLLSGEAPEAGADAAARRRFAEARKKAFQRALDALQQAHKVRQEGELIWPL